MDQDGDMHTFERETRPARIVIAGPDGTVSAAAGRHLRNHGHQVRDVRSGDEALQMIDETAPDVVLLDPTLTTSDGEGVLEVLGQDADYAMFVIALTLDDPSQIESAMSRGAHDHITRPFHEVTLLARVESATKMKQLRDEVTRQRDTLSRLVRVDVLTGLTNRAQLEAQLRQTTATALRHSRPLSIVLIDIDHFGHINDIGGNVAGDMVLQDVARRIMGDIRTGDIAGRWDGDQFMMILPETDVRGAGVLAERLRLSISGAGVEMPDTTMRSISASLGCAEGSDIAELLRTAGVQLTEAIRQGGNAVA